LSSLFRVAWFDLRQELTPPIPILSQWATFGLQLLVYGALISRLIVAIPDYLQFYAVGYVVILVFDVATISGRRFVELGHSGKLPYLLSLPLPRWKLFVATAMQGGIWLALTISVPLLVTLVLIGTFTLVSIIAALASIFLLGFGASGLMLALSFIAFKSADAYLAAVAGMNTLSVRFSTVLYPLIILPPLYAGLALLSPLTYGSDLVRLFLGVTVGSSLNLALQVWILAALTVTTLGSGIYLLERLVEGVKNG
jgi:hypothetical protein